jgi:membrane protease YdiL (CAAX protease family)
VTGGLDDRVAGRAEGRWRAWLAPPRPEHPAELTDPRERRLAGLEVWLVFGLTLGLSGLRSALSLVQSLLRTLPLSRQHVALNAPAALNQYVDLALQLANAWELVAWGLLGAYLLVRSGVRLRDIGLDRLRPGRDALLAAGLAALIGIPGLGLYLVAHALGLALTVQPSTLTDTWWRLPVLVVSAAGNAFAEEVLLTGYLLTRLRSLGWSENRAVGVSALVRGCYHLYQGFGGGIGNLVMGAVFGRVWQRTGRLWALVGAHTLLDVVAFLGYALLAGHVGWLPH